MKTKQAKPQKLAPVQDQTLTLMAVQEKLGMFAKPTEKLLEEHEHEHEYLKKKPLGLI